MITSDTTLPLKLTPLFDVRYGITPFQMFGDTPFGRRLQAATSGGTFAGERLRGEVLPGGTDWITGGADGSMRLDADLSLRTDDGAMIHAHWDGKLVASPAVLMQIVDPAKRGDIDPASYYLRYTASFVTGAAAYAWLNGIAAVGTARFTAEGLQYSFGSVD
jgi:hypothetical protein